MEPFMELSGSERRGQGSGAGGLPTSVGDKQETPNDGLAGGLDLRAGMLASDLLVPEMRGLSLVRGLVPANDDLPAG